MSRTFIDPSLIPSLAPNNILDNGGFEIWQRGTTFSAPASNSYGPDRWSFQNNEPANVTATKETSTVDNGLASMKVVVASAGASKTWYLIQIIENFVQMRGRTVTLTIRVKCDTASAVKVGIYDGTLSESSYHTGGNAWETLTVTATIGGAASQLQIMVGALDNGDKKASTYYIDSAMLTFGPSPVAFTPTSPALDMLRCQRFYQRVGGEVSSQSIITGYAFTTTQATHAFNFRMSMRAAPTVTVTGPTSFTSTGIALTAMAADLVSSTSMRISTTVASGLTVGQGSMLLGSGSVGVSFIELSADL